MNYEFRKQEYFCAASLTRRAKQAAGFGGSAVGGTVSAEGAWNPETLLQSPRVLLARYIWQAPGLLPFVAIFH
jgi:hypothetical protein